MRRKFSKKVRRGRKRVSKQKMSIRRMPLLYPDRLLTKCVYSENVIFSSPGSFNSTFYRTNNPYDPRYAIGGGQPKGFDMYSTMYTYGYVTSCVMRVTGFSPLAVFNPLVLGIYHSDGTSAAPSTEAMAEDNPKNICTLVRSGGGGAGGYSNYRISKRMYPWVPTGRTREVFLQNPLNQFSATSGPSNENIATFFFYSIGTSAAPGQAINFDIRITYNMTWFNRRNVVDV
jgi:hypothetical protein